MQASILKENGRHYHHLSDTDVAVIVTRVKELRRNGTPRMSGMSEIARETGCSVDTVYRIYRQSMVELMKPSPTADGFDVSSVEHNANAAVFRRRKGRQVSSMNACKREKSSQFIDRCLAYIKESRLHTIDEAVGYLGPTFPGTVICTKTFYNYVNGGNIDGYCRKDLPRAPRWKTKKKYKQYTAKDSRGRSILDRPESINARKEFGHWEGDLVTGPRDGENGAYLTLIERTTRFYLMIPVRNKKQRTVTDALVEYSKSHPAFMKACRTITFDNGIEFGLWREMEERLGITTYFGRPYHSCDRGSNENCNGLVRRFVRKGTDINGIDSETTRQINREINEKRRRLLGYESAEASFSKALEKEGIGYESMYP